MKVGFTHPKKPGGFYTYMDLIPSIGDLVVLVSGLRGIVTGTAWYIHDDGNHEVMVRLEERDESSN